MAHKATIKKRFENWRMCSICGAIGDYDFGNFVETHHDPVSGLFEVSEDWRRYRYACPLCQQDEGAIIAPPDEQQRLRRLWWQGTTMG